MKFSESEKKIITKIRREVFRDQEYNFWFVYNNTYGDAIDYEGGYALPKNIHFRNTYTLPIGLYKRIIKTGIVK